MQKLRHILELTRLIYRITLFLYANIRDKDSGRKNCSLKTGRIVLIRIFLSTKRKVSIRVRTFDPQNSSPPSYQLHYNNYRPPFFTNAFIVSKLL